MVPPRCRLLCMVLGRLFLSSTLLIKRTNPARLLGAQHLLASLSCTSNAPAPPAWANKSRSCHSSAAATASAMPTRASSPPSPKQAIDFLLLLQKLKLTKRTGWVRKCVQGPESIADHMYRMGMMGLIAGDCGVDSNRCIRMAIVHDVAESIVGDITPHCNVSKEDKSRMERDAITTIQGMLGGESSSAAREVEELWSEYEAGVSPEAQLVKDFDKLEMIVQAYEYEEAQPGLQLQEFFDSTAGRFKTELGQAWAQELLARRRAGAAAAGATGAASSEAEDGQRQQAAAAAAAAAAQG